MTESSLKHVVFGIPSLLHQVSLGTFVSQIETDRLMILNGIAISYLPIGGDPFPWKVRSKIASMFLVNYPDATDLFFIDDDVGYPSEKVLEFLHRPEDILVGVYPLKQDQGGFPVDLMADADGAPIAKQGLVKIASAGFGFTRIKRHVLEKLQEIVPTFREPGNDQEYHQFFLEGVSNGVAWGEDKYFYTLAQQEGFEVWADPNIFFTHQGRKRWSGNLTDVLSKQFPDLL